MHTLLIDHNKERRRRRQKKIMIETTKEKDRQCTSRGSQGACAGEAGLVTPTLGLGVSAIQRTKDWITKHM